MKSILLLVCLIGSVAQAEDFRSCLIRFSPNGHWGSNPSIYVSCDGQLLKQPDAEPFSDDTHYFTKNGAALGFQGWLTRFISDGMTIISNNTAENTQTVNLAKMNN